MNSPDPRRPRATFLRPLLAVALPIAGLVALVACTVVATEPAPNPGPAGEPTPSPGVADFEVKWMTAMIDHHTMAIQMADMCVEKAVHGELQAMCKNIISAQKAEINKMRSWLMGWYGVEYNQMGSMKPDDTHQMEQLAAMSGGDFEVAFMEAMIQHHIVAVKEAEQLRKSGQHEELLAMGQSIITTQNAEIESMRTWLCLWYQKCEEGSLPGEQM